MRYKTVLQTIGRTPLVELQKIGKDLPAVFWVKLEAMNPGGSIKDRIGLRMIEAAEESGKLKPGATIIEATAGNTGVGLAQAAAAKGYKSLFVMPDKMSREKADLLKAYGATIVWTKTNVPPDHPEYYTNLAKKIASETPNSFVPSQFTNPNNPQTHYETTGPEIWEETGGKVDVLVAGVGTGGTISGCGRYLKEKNKKLKVVLADPPGSLLSGGDGSSWLVEGIGEDFFPETYNKEIIDEIFQVTDKESFLMARRLTREEGLFVGGSSGTAMVAALKYAEKTKKKENIVVILPDTGRNYLSKCHSDDWMREKGFLE
ncbi:MAG: cysteine synthase family protein [bacterium]|nr:cysteine synthase family protein [bacterium]